MTEQTHSCKNCEKPFDDQYEFCPHCGQKAKDELTIKVLFYNTISNYFSVDARFFKSFIPLLFKPGYLATRFIEGKRLLYLHPAQMYLFITVVFFFLFSFTARDQKESINTQFEKVFDQETLIDSTKINQIKDSLDTGAIVNALNKNKVLTGVDKEELKALDSIIKNKDIDNDFSFGFNKKEVDSLIKIKAKDEVIYKSMGLEEDAGSFKKRMFAQALKFYKKRDGGSIYQAFIDTIPIAMFVLLPIFAFILKLLFFKSGRFTHHLVFSFYFFSFLFTVFSILLIVSYTWDVIPGWIQGLIILSTFIYLFLAVKRFYGQGWFLSLFKTGTATVVYMMVVVPIAITIISAFAFLYY